MKKALLLLVMIMVMLVGCNSGPKDSECESAKRQMEMSGEILLSDPLNINYIINTNHPPDSVGFILRECIESGWDYR